MRRSIATYLLSKGLGLQVKTFFGDTKIEKLHSNYKRKRFFSFQ